jgi:hypothetical protein
VAEAACADWNPRFNDKELLSLALPKSACDNTPNLVDKELCATHFMRQHAGLCTNSIAEASEVLDALVGTWYDTLGQIYKVTKA